MYSHASTERRPPKGPWQKRPVAGRTPTLRAVSSGESSNHTGAPVPVAAVTRICRIRDGRSVLIDHSDRSDQAEEHVGDRSGENKPGVGTYAGPTAGVDDPPGTAVFADGEWVTSRECGDTQ